MMKEFPINTFFRILILLTCITSVTLTPLQAYSAEPVIIGVLAFRPKTQTLAQWQPLVAVLKQAIPAHDFEIKVFTFPELEKAVASKQLDFVLTNPAHYVLLNKRSGLSAPLATLATIENGLPVMKYGGVIFTRAERQDVNTLSDIRNKTIAVVNTDSFGGYQMQAYELSQIGINLHGDKTIITGMPHDNVVDAVLKERADVGFVRTGLIESMARDGKLDIKKIKIINRQNLVNFPVQTSTHLYPEWAFASMPNVDEDLARHVAATLYVLEENTAATQVMGIHGFVVPADYTPVADLLKELRVRPFDITPTFTVSDIWTRYSFPLIGALIGLCLIILLSIRLLFTKYKLDAEHLVTLQQQKKLHESELHLRTIIANEPECIKIVDAQGHLLEMNPAGLAMVEAESLAQLVGQPVQNLIAPEYRSAFAKMHAKVIAGKAMQMEFEVIGLKGGRRWLETHAVPIQDNGDTVHLAVTRDITERKKMEEQVRQLAFFDPLTNLPNRRLVNDRLNQAMSASKRSNTYGALMFLDLDNFKPINDIYGHGVGDLLLIEAARRLQSCMREMDTVGRFGGDEFVVILIELDADKAVSVSQATIVAEKIRARLSEPYVLKLANDRKSENTVEHHCTASIGVTLFINHETSQDDLMKWTDAAMYEAKEAGRNQIRFYVKKL
jgi:diguanylate cyclase (GGDEF)-like protein/PAS domain S-box-containing protein